MKSLTVGLIVLLNMAASNAAVWEDTQEWSLAYEEKYSEWMKSPAVREKMFTDKNSPYHGINTDCADTAYAFRAIFAFENKLPFAIINPSGARVASKTLNNRSAKFDKAGPENKRVVALINEIGDSVGTENLTRFDTYSPAINAIGPGTLFTYKIKARFGNFIRHTYNIKNINPVGTFDVIYSTQANQEKRGDLLRRRDREFENLPNDPWGFRRFRWPDQLGKNVSEIPAELSASNEQYELLTKFNNTRAYFKYISKTLSTTNESSTERLTRLLSAVCVESQARIDYINEALVYLQNTKNACMDYQKFDAFSTPARDSALKEMFENLKYSLADAKSNGETKSEAYALVDYIFNKKGNVQADLLAKCPINYRAGVSIDLQTLWSRLANNRLSSHPNDKVENRWGETTSGATKCKRWY